MAVVVAVDVAVVVVVGFPVAVVVDSVISLASTAFFRCYLIF